MKSNFKTVLFRLSTKPHLTLMVILAMILFQDTAIGQTKSFIEYQQNITLTEQQQHFADAWIKKDWVKSFKYISINPDYFKKDVLQVNLPDNSLVTISKHELIEKTGGLFSWKGKYAEGFGNGDFVVNGDMITARISSLNAVYLIYPLSGGLHVILECSSVNMPLDESAEGYQQMIEQGIKNAAEKQPSRIDPEMAYNSEAKLLGGDCKVRVLVMLTNTAASNLADPIGFVNSCIDATNTAYDNSAVNFNVELAVSTNVAYTESLNSTTDKTRFRNTGDGFLDNVHDLRTYFDADMCVLVTENLQSGICGEAYTVANSPYADAFCVVTRGCAVGNLSFPHELGHLYGCRHDPYVDNTNTPYAYGHGYVYFSGRWRTVMAYNNYCSDNGASCTRIQYFSNPAVSFNGNATGVANANDNESALEASRANISSLEATLPNKIFSNAYTFNSGEQSDIIATSTVTNTNTFVLNSGSSGTWRSGGSITMATGFWAKSGSKFQAYSDNCTALKPTNEQGNIVAGKMPSSLTENGGIDLFPNPFVNNFDVAIFMKEDTKAHIRVYNSIGTKVTELSGVGLSKGSNKITINGSRFAKGIYLVEVNINEVKTIKKIIKL